jgi:hypothetical protein
MISGDVLDHRGDQAGIELPDLGVMVQHGGGEPAAGRFEDAGVEGVDELGVAVPLGEDGLDGTCRGMA